MYASSGRQFQSFNGPADPQLRRSEIEGYQPVSRIGEIVVNAFGACSAAGARSRLPASARVCPRMIVVCDLRS